MNTKLGLYIHIPFCNKKCPYCDFFSKTKNSEDIDFYTNALLKSIKYWGNKTDRAITSIYFGGGTPNMLGVDNLCKVLSAVYKNFTVEKNAEITTELNPTYSDSIDFKKLLKTGFNRLSFGMQSANDEELKFLNREHTSEEVKSVIKKAQNDGFKNISLDLMLGIPKQTKSSLTKSIKFCKDCNVEHISAYILKVEENTPFYKNQSSLNIPDSDAQADLYLLACEELEKAGYYQYEISNFSKKGFESRHNLTYWECEEYIGIGPSAHSFFNGKRFYYPRSFKDFYNNNITEDGFGGDEKEYIMLNLRLAKGINFKDFEKRFSKKISGNIISKAKLYERNGFINFSENGINLTRKGFLVSNYIIADLI